MLSLSTLAASGFVVILFCLTRSIHEIAKPSAYSSDGFVHMIIAREIRSNGYRLPDKISVSPFNWSFTYPFFLHYFLSFIPERYYGYIDRVFPLMMDISYISILFLLLPLGLINLYELFLVFILFTSTPQFILRAGGKGLSARKPGVLWATLSILCYYLWLTGGAFWFLLGSLLFGGLTHLTSRFGTQALVFIFLGFSLINVVSLIVIPLTFLVGIIVSRGHYSKVMKFHAIHLYYYATNRQFVRFYSGFKSIDTFLSLVMARSFRDFLESIYRSIFLKSLLNNPFAIAAISIVIWSSLGNSVSIDFALIVWLIIGMVSSFLTSIRGLRFLGPPGRYFTFVFLPGALIVVQGFSSLQVLYSFGVWFVIVFGLAVIGGWGVFFHLTASPPEYYTAIEEVLEFFKRSESPTIITQPRNLGSKIAWRLPNVKVADYVGSGFTSLKEKEDYEKIFSRDPYITEDTTIISDLVDPDWVLFRSKSVDKRRSPILRQPNCPPAFENEWFEIYEWSDITDSS